MEDENVSNLSALVISKLSGFSMFLRLLPLLKTLALFLQG